MDLPPLAAGELPLEEAHQLGLGDEAGSRPRRSAGRSWR
jgi:hypothetical protein